MQIKRQIVETIGDQDIEQIMLINDQGTCARFLSLGATWQSFTVKDQEGREKECILGLERPSDYLRSHLCAGQVVGRVAGRIKEGRIDLDGTSLQLPCNQKGHCLHGGPEGFHTQVWKVETELLPSLARLTFSYHAKEAVDGFPGDLWVLVTYELDETTQLTLTFTARDATKETLFNPTNHVYFNLSERQDLETHSLKIRSQEYLEVDQDLIPTGRRIPISGTAFDFGQARDLGPALGEMGGLDHAFIVGEDARTPIAVLCERESGDQIEVYSDRSALVVYSLNDPEELTYFTRDQGKACQKHQGLALEAQFAPDAIHHPEWGDTRLHPGQTKEYQIRFVYKRGN
ncbi:aldose epimerase family protein [Streptococcus sp. DD13]|uniref:aldose epimerase family protein n=1 Tax=Streptococcus sp. DD13 TaxID=1777881 RepID=UPI0007938BE7|nr:aldose epimerase family protein [Streptococcus sp. DD13]KXT79034.1 Aldose 1-epimerase [Streptococcus sp. DD13]